MELIFGAAVPTLAAIVGGFASVVVLIIVLAMCNICQKPPNKDKWLAEHFGKDYVSEKLREPTLKEIISTSDKSTSLPNHTSVHEDNETATGKKDSILRHSNGSAVRESKNGDRPTSHDQRALPAIPYAGSGQGLTTDDDEDVDEGHYDVISNRRRKASTPQTASNTASPSRQNLYEKVEDIDPAYAGIKSVSSDPGYAGAGPGTATTGVVAGKETHPYAVVNGIGAAGYAHIEEKASSTNPRMSQIQVLGIAPQASVETLDSFTSGPPVPDKNFVVSDSEVELSSAITPREGASPNLPPRNGDRNSNPLDGTVSSGVIGASDSSSSNQMTGSISSSPPASILSSVVTIAPSTGVDSTNGPVQGKKKGPDYSSVTARESLANIRERQAAEMRAQNPQDAMYETVNYDAVKVPKNNNDNDRGQRNSLISDLYAEIASASGENSTRSSMYARVGDIHAPTPPPVDLLRNLSSVPSPDESDEPDPGYSMIRRTRPQSAFPTSNTSPAKPSSSNSNRQRVLQDDTCAIYAVIDKTRKNRATIHISENVESDLEKQLGTSNYNSNQQVYAQVNKHSRQGSAASSMYDNPIDYQGTGARPKVRTTSAEENPYSNNTELKHKKAQANPPYQSIPSTDDPYSRIKEDPYAKVQDIDPYAQIKDADPYSTVKDPNNPYSKIRDTEPPYSKVKDSDSAGYSRIKDVNGMTKSNSEEVAGYSSIKDIAPCSAGDPNYAVIPGDPGALRKPDSDPDPNYDQIPTDNVPAVRVAHGYATEISAEDVADGNNNPNGMVHIGSHQVNRDFWSRREHLYEEITVGKEQAGQQVTVHRPSQHHQQYSVHRLSTDL